MTRRGSALVTLAVAVWALGACSIDEGADVASYRRVLDGDDPPAVALPAEGQPLSLLVALRLANRQNERLAIEGENYVQALIARKRAAAAFLPTIDGRASIGAAEAPTGAPGGANATHDIGFRADQLLFGGPRTTAEIERREDLVKAGRFRLLDLQESLLIDVARVYFRILRSERLVTVLTNSLSLQEERVRDAKARQQVGMARVLDVAQNDAQASRTRVSLIDARNDVANGRVLLENLTASPVRSLALTEDVDLATRWNTVDEARLCALTTRQDVRAADARMRAARHAVDVAYGRYIPTIDLSAAFSVDRDASPPGMNWSIFVSLLTPIFSAGLIEDDIRQALSELRQAEQTLSAIRRGVELEVDVVWQDLAAARTRLAELDTQLASAQTAYRQSDESYKVGLATNLERLVAQDVLLSAQLQISSTTYDVRLLELELLRTLGMLADVLAVRGDTESRPDSRP